MPDSNGRHIDCRDATTAALAIKLELAVFHQKPILQIAIVALLYDSSVAGPVICFDPESDGHLRSGIQAWTVGNDDFRVAIEVKPVVDLSGGPVGFRDGAVIAKVVFVFEA